MNSELAKRQGVAQGRMHRLKQRAQACRVRLAHLLEQDHCLQERMGVYKQRRDELWIQVIPFEAAGRTEERDYFPVKAQHLAADWEVRRCTAKLEKNAERRQS